MRDKIDACFAAGVGAFLQDISDDFWPQSAALRCDHLVEMGRAVPDYVLSRTIKPGRVSIDKRICQARISA